jgi:hypothetical protein
LPTRENRPVVGRTDRERRPSGAPGQADDRSAPRVDLAVKTPAGVRQLHSLIGNRATGQLLRAKAPGRMLQRFGWNDMDSGLTAESTRRLIRDSKASGGHADERHIFIGWGGVMQREIPAASAFASEDDAVECIKAIVNKHLDEIEDHVSSAANKNKDFVWKEKFADLKVWGYGTGGARGAAYASVGGEVTVVLRYRPNLGAASNIFLTTAYPEDRPSTDFFSKTKQKHDYERHREASAAYKKKMAKEFEKYLDRV